MFSGKLNQKAFKAPITVVLALLFPLCLYSQSRADSAVINYDSIQDSRVDRIEWHMDRRITRIKNAQDATTSEIDSHAVALEQFQDQLSRLEEEKLLQIERLSALQEQLDQSTITSMEYRLKLQRILWVTASVLLILMIASCLFLLLYSVKTRKLLDKLRWNMKRLGKDLRKDIKKRLKTMRIRRKKK